MDSLQHQLYQISISWQVDECSGFRLPSRKLGELPRSIEEVGLSRLIVDDLI